MYIYIYIYIYTNINRVLIVRIYILIQGGTIAFIIIIKVNFSVLLDQTSFRVLWILDVLRVILRPSYRCYLSIGLNNTQLTNF